MSGTPAVSQSEDGVEKKNSSLYMCDSSLTPAFLPLSAHLQVCRSLCQSASWMSSPWTSSLSAGARPTLTL